MIAALFQFNCQVISKTTVVIVIRSQFLTLGWYYYILNDVYRNAINAILYDDALVLQKHVDINCRENLEYSTQVGYAYSILSAETTVVVEKGRFR